MASNRAPFSREKENNGEAQRYSKTIHVERFLGVVMILPQVHLRKPCYDFTFL